MDHTTFSLSLSLSLLPFPPTFWGDFSHPISLGDFYCLPAYQREEKESKCYWGRNSPQILIVLLGATLGFGERWLCIYFIGCCGFFGLFGRVLKVVLPNVLPISVAGIFRGQESELCLCSGEHTVVL